MNVEIYSMGLGFDDCYIIRSDSTAMIDGGAPGKTEKFKKAVNDIPVQPHDIGLIVVTHGHIDHIGSLREIKEFTGAKVAVHRLDKECVEKGEWLETHIPKGVGRWGWTAHMTVPLIMLMWPKAPPTEVDIVVEDEGLPLSQYGIPGRIIYTPGHTLGSLSVLLDSGEAFVGDLAMNKLPLRRNPGLPVLASDIAEVKESWRRLLNLGAKTVYPGHGRPFSAEVIKKALG